MSSWALRLASRVSGLFRQKRAEFELDSEMQTHLQMLTEKFIRQGMGPEDAELAALRQFGNTTLLRQRHRESRTFQSFSTVFQDARYGLRVLRRGPGFTAIAAISLALAIGANTSIFSLAKSLLYDRLHVAHADQLRMLRWAADKRCAVESMWGDFDPDPGGGGMLGSVFSYPVYQQLRAHNATLEDLLAYKEDSMNATMRGNAQRVDVDLISGNFYAVLGAQPQLGRAIQPTDDATPGAGAVAVISEGVWEREFGRSPAVLGQTITVNQIPLTIVGVNPRGFTGAKNAHDSPDVFVPLSMQPVVDPKGRKGSLLNDSDMWWLNVVGRARPGVADAQAEAALNVELAAATRATMTVKPNQTTPRLVLADGGRGLNYAARMFRKPVYVLMTMTGFVLLLACANIANLLLARGAQRQREMSVRLALGAGRGRVLRQMLTESLLLAGIGGAGGLLLGYLGRNAIPWLMSTGWRNTFDVPMDWGVFAFAAGVTLLTGLIFGLAPAWLAARSEVSSSLKESAQTTTRRRKGLGGKAIVGFQIGLSTLLVVGAGLFLRTLLALNAVDVGFRTDHLILFEVSPPVHRYGPGKDVALHQRLEHEFAALPGVEGVAPSWMAYIANNMDNSDFIPEGERETPGQDQGENMNAVSNAFFQTMGIPMVAGRSFGTQDTTTSEKVAVINESLAKKRFPNVNAVGRRFKSDDALYRIVGVCGNNLYRNLRDEAPPQFFLLYVQQRQVGGMTYAIRSHVDAGTLAPALRRVVQQVDRDLPIVDVRTQREQIDENMQTERMFAALTTGFGVLALGLACVGIYGVMAYSVANRRNEIGIRLALGAQPRQVRGMILRESAWLAVTGIVVGVGAAMGLTRLVKSMLFGIQPYDPATMIAGIMVLLAVALAASWIPARRAARVQPMQALRHE
ncbi:MAG: ABC transporter permease [Terracidiphilus sp.]